MDTETVDRSIEESATSCVPPAASTQPSAASGVSPMTRKKNKLSKTLPTDRIPFARQLEIIAAIPVAHEKAGGPITFKEVGAIIGMSEATLMQASAFFGDVGLIQRVEGGKFNHSPELQDYYRLHQFAPEKAWSKLAPIFERSWFGQEIVPRLKIRALEEKDALVCLAEASNAEKVHEAQLRLALEFLQRVGLISRDGNQLRLGSISDKAAQAEEELSLPKVSGPPKTEHEEDEGGLEKHTLTLNPAAKRKFIIQAPPEITAAELKRIQDWLSFQLIITPSDVTQP